MTIAIGIAFALLGFACVLSVIGGLPGTWMLLGLGALIELTDHLLLDVATATTFGWWLLAGGLLAAIAGEGLEFFSGVLGAKSGGGSRRGMIGSVVGGLAGALVLTFVLPLVGTLVGAIVGTFAGAMIGETTGQAARSKKEALAPAFGATVARIIAIIAKGGIAIVVWAVLTVAAFL